MGILRPIVQAFVHAVLHARERLLFGRAIAGQLIRDQYTWDVVASLEQFPKELLGSLFVRSALHEDIEHISMLINCSPQLVQFAVDFEKDLIKMPLVASVCRSLAQLVGRVLPKGLAPLTDGLVGQHDSPLS